ncbi:MAG: hypothetical protein WC450_11560 [Candidatus Omnitrophota bacterium]
MSLKESILEYDRLLYAPVDPDDYPRLLMDLRKRAGHSSENNYIARDVKNDGEWP